MAQLSTIDASSNTLAILSKLHAESKAQESRGWSAEADGFFLDKFVALEQDKCEFMYLIARSIGAVNIVEAGTSFGVSTIYLALAVGQNVRDGRAPAGASRKVIGTEKEAAKADRARSIWNEAGHEEVAKWIDLRVGDLRETLKEDLPETIDMLLLDIWTPLALPAVEMVMPRLRRGAVILMDNVVSSKKGYADLFAYLADKKNGFQYTQIPYSNGFGMAVFSPKPASP